MIIICWALFCFNKHNILISRSLSLCISSRYCYDIQQPLSILSIVRNNNVFQLIKCQESPFPTEFGQWSVFVFRFISFRFVSFELLPSDRCWLRIIYYALNLTISFLVSVFFCLSLCIFGIAIWKNTMHITTYNKRRTKPIRQMKWCALKSKP